MDYYLPDLKQANDYFPFGMAMPGRIFSNSALGYRYGFNGQEKSDDVTVGNYNAEYWEYDSRLGRRWNRDIVDKAWISDYSVLGNNPMYFIDPNGADWYRNNKTGDAKWFKGHRRHKGFTYLGDKNYVFETKNSQLAEVVVVGRRRQKTYEQLANDNPQVSFAVSGAYSTALSLYTGRYNTYGSVSSSTMNNLTEEQKQADFKTNSPKTTGILIYEYLTGTGPEHRSFDETHSITDEIKNSEASRLAAWHMADLFNSGQFQDGQTIRYYAAMAPDGGISKTESIRRHLHAWGSTPATFYRGGMRYSMTRSGNDVIVKVTDAFTVMSMIRVRETINRVPGEITPLGRTTVEFNFVWKNALLKK